MMLCTERQPDRPAAQPPEKIAARGGRCSDCCGHYAAHTPVARVNGRTICLGCAESYQRDANGTWVKKAH